MRKNGAPIHDEVLPLRAASRDVIRELGFLQSSYVPAEINHSHCHALIELESGPMHQNELARRLRLDKSTTSRVVDRLVEKGWVKPTRNDDDRRRAVLRVTPSGARKLAAVHATANAEVHAALDLLTAEQRATVLDGIRLYAEALGRSRARARYAVRKIRREDDAGVADVIRTVMTEHGASGPGFAIHDAEVAAMHATYTSPRSAYFVVLDGDHVMGGAGIAPLSGADRATCELRKMYFRPELRGLGFGQTLIDLCLGEARRLGFKRCYLETLESMQRARSLYLKNGFAKLCGPLGKTGHFSCDTYYARDL
jgi:putative acetyltransferase